MCFNSQIFVFSWWVFAPFSCRLFESSEEEAEQSEENKPESVPHQPVSQSYAATVALPSTPPSSATLLGTVALNSKGPNEHQQS